MLWNTFMFHVIDIHPTVEEQAGVKPTPVRVEAVRTPGPMPSVGSAIRTPADLVDATCSSFQRSWRV